MPSTSIPCCKLVTTQRYSVYSTNSTSSTGSTVGTGDGGSCSNSRSISNEAVRRGHALSTASNRTVVQQGCDGDNRNHAATDEGMTVPRMQLRDMKPANASRFVGLMEKHGFVVLTDIGVIRRRYLELMRLLKAFFDVPAEAKELCKGAVHFNERGIPMWHTGYERCGRVREAFRIPTSSCKPTAPQQHQPWPSGRLRSSWASLLHLLQLVCHRALTLTLGRPVYGAPTAPQKRNHLPSALPCSSQSPEKDRGEEEDARGQVSSDGGDRALDARNSSTEAEGVGLSAELGKASPRVSTDGGGLAKDDDSRRGSSVCGDGVQSRVVEVDADVANCDDSRGVYFDRLSGSGESGAVERHAVQDGRQTGWGGRCGEIDSFRRQHDDDSMSDEGGTDGEDDDFSVSYALHYPNEFADPSLEEEDLTVGEHVDPSLYVAEPCCGVEGLEIQDRATGRWLPVEALCASLAGSGQQALREAEGRELVLFGGKALERATQGRIKGAPHRVRRGDLGRRYCFIYEQKYAEFFPPPVLD